MFNLNQTKKYLLNICLDVTPLSKRSMKDTRQGWVKNNMVVFLDEDGYQNKQLAIAEILKDSFIRDNIPEALVADSVNAIISETLKQPLAKRDPFLKTQLENLEKKLQLEIFEWFFLIPIENFKIKRKIQFGSITFYPANQIQRKYVQSLFRRVLKNNTHYSTKEKEDIINRQLIEFDRTALFVTCFAEVKTNGILDIVYQESIKKVRLALNIYRLYFSQKDDNNKSFFGINGEIIPRNLRYTMRYTANKKQLNPIIERIGYVFPFEIDDKRIAFMRKNGFYQLKQIFSNPIKTDFERRLLTAIFWYGEAINNPIFYERSGELSGVKSKKSKIEKFEYFDINQRLLKLMISLESILIFNENEPLQVNISERAAFLLSNRYDQRKNDKTTIKRFYEIRSKIVHHGEMYVSLEDVNEFTSIVQAVLLILLKLKNKVPLIDHDNLREYFEKIKLS